MPGTRSLPRAPLTRHCAPSGDGERRHDHPARCRRLGRHAGGGSAAPRRRLLLVRGDRAGTGRGRRGPRRSCPACSPSSPPPGSGCRCRPAAARSPTAPRCGSRWSATRTTEFVPCFTSVQRLTAWADLADAAHASRRRAGDARHVVPHLVVPAAGLAGRLPAGVGLALNPDSVPGLPLYPECVPYLARHRRAVVGPPRSRRADRPPAGRARHAARRARAALWRAARRPAAAAAWLAVPGQGEGLVIAVTLDDPAASPPARPRSTRSSAPRRRSRCASRSRSTSRSPASRRARTRSPTGSRATPAPSTSAPSRLAPGARHAAGLPGAPRPSRLPAVRRSAAGVVGEGKLQPGQCRAHASAPRGPRTRSGTAGYGSAGHRCAARLRYRPQGLTGRTDERAADALALRDPEAETKC